MRLIVLLLLGLVFGCENETGKENINKTPEQAVQKVTIKNENPEQVADPAISTDYLMGKFNPKTDDRFEEIPIKLASRKDMFLRKEALKDFEAMHDAAAKEGITLKIISATRPFDHQKRIWEAKWTGARKVDGMDISKTIPNVEKRALKILEYSSMPGTSRHHWGTDLDINQLTNDYFEKGKGKKEYDWLVKNASRFGFCQTYTPKGAERPDGYNEEKWHWSYLPISKKLTEQYKLRIKNESIQGFKGAESASGIDVVAKYVLGINKACL